MNKTAKNSLIYLIGTIFTALIGFANTMILTRMLSNQTYAMYGLLSTLVTATITFLSLGYDAAYTRFYYCHGDTQKHFLLKCLKLPLIAFLLFAMILYEPTQKFLILMFNNKFTFAGISILAAYILFALLQRFTQLTARMEEHAVNFVISNLIARAGFLIIVAVVYYTCGDVSFNWVVASFGISSFIAVAINLYVVQGVKGINGNATERTDNKILLEYGFPYVINNTLILIIPLIERLIIRKLAGWETLSIYTAAAIFSTIIMMISNMIDNIWQPIVYKQYENPEEFKPLLHIFGLSTTSIMTFGLACCILLRRWLVLILDSNYFSVYIIAPAILYSACFNVIAGIYGVGINIEKKTIHLVISPLIQIILSMGLCYALIPQFGLCGVGIAVIISIFVSRIYRVAIGLHFYGTGIEEYKAYILWIICAGISVVSMFFTSIVSDVVLFIFLILIMALLLNKDCNRIYKEILHLLKEKDI